MKQYVIETLRDLDTEIFRLAIRNGLHDAFGADVPEVPALHELLTAAHKARWATPGEVNAQWLWQIVCTLPNKPFTSGDLSKAAKCSDTEAWALLYRGVHSGMVVRIAEDLYQRGTIPEEDKGTITERRSSLGRWWGQLAQALKDRDDSIVRSASSKSSSKCKKKAI